MKSILTFGSINMDLVTQTPRLPRAGETIQGYQFFTAPGGKGANQAVAAAQLGGCSQLVGRVGNDDFGNQLLQHLQSGEVNTNGVFMDASTHSGLAIITVDETGENQIIIVPGANGRMNETDVARLKPLLPGATALLMQLEIPLSTVILAAQAAQSVGVPVILDPAPAQDLPETLYPLIEIITPNQLEASQLVGFPVHDKESAQQAAAILQQRGVSTVIVKLGAEGVCCQTKDEFFFVPAFAVKVVDTVAAGDAFNGALAVGLAEGLSLREAVLWGVAAGAMAVTKVGAQPSLPNRESFNQFLQERGVG